MTNKSGLWLGVSDEELSSLTDHEIDELNARTIFVRDAMPDAWFDYAEELLESAEILWTRQEEGLRG